MMQVAVVGGGVCGLTCAVALMKAGIDVQIYEAAVSLLSSPFVNAQLIQVISQAQFGEIGAGIGIGIFSSTCLCTLLIGCSRTQRSPRPAKTWPG